MESVVARRGTVVALIESMRLHQWAKNLLIFVPLALGGKLTSFEAWWHCFIGFVAFGVFASATYILNHLRDLSADRLHWSKCRRPIARGDLHPVTALAFATAGLFLALAIAAQIDRESALLLLAYGLISAAYSLGLKRLPIADVLTLATLLTFRLWFGIELAGLTASPWLLAFGMFIFTSLSLAKRYVEVHRVGILGKQVVEGRGYLAGDAPLLLGIGSAAAVGAVLLMVVYLIEEAFIEGLYSSPALLWGMPFIFFLWLGRIWLLAVRNRLDDDPILFAIRDRASVAMGVMTAILFLGAWQL